MSVPIWSRVCVALLAIPLPILGDATYARETHKPTLVLQVGHQKAITSVAYSRDGRYFLTGSLDGTAILWDAATGEQLRTFRSDAGPIFGVAFSPDGKRMATCGKDEIGLYDPSTGKRTKVFRPKYVRGRLSFSPDGKHLLIDVPRLGHHGIAQAILFDLETGHFHTLSHGKPLEATHDAIASCFSPDGKFILTGSDDKVGILWRTEDREKIRTFHGHGGPVAAVAFSPDGKRVVTGSSDKNVILWDAVTAKKLAHI